TLAFVVNLEHGKVGHEAVRRGAVPVLLSRLEEHTISWPDDFNLPTTTLAKANAFGDIDGLAVGMRMPRRPRARCEVDAARRQARGRRRRRDRVDEDHTGEPLTWPSRGLDGVSRDLHFVLRKWWDESRRVHTNDACADLRFPQRGASLSVAARASGFRTL